MKITHLKLDCANLDELKYFYTRRFNFELLSENEEEISIKIGKSILTFRENRLKKAYYHFAFNIPYEAVNEANDWLSKKVEILETDTGKVKDFEAWNAQALFFIDPAGNVVEFVGRKKIKAKKPKTFNEKSVMGISEVGLPVFQVSSVIRYLEDTVGVKKFSTTINSTFSAAGSDEGLFIIVDSVEHTWYPTDQLAREYPLEVHFKMARNKAFVLTLDNDDLNVIAGK